MRKDKLIKGAITNGVINGIINVGIQYFLLKESAPIAISVDSITNTAHTVLGEAVFLAITLALITTIIGYFTIKEEKVPFFPTAFWLTIKHGFFTFGVVTSLAVLWQKYFGTVEVSLITALFIIGAIASIVAGVVNYLTLKSSLKLSHGNN
ncbi:hypothetical protein [Polaribacter sp. IC073]|uniref:hypothetical protein n=1 Tax=Polaribacter sp. IC073 TaxID=2508540 RepID=UPI0011BF841E|nr:hypothetical protein [Polaribacter sp. IC073]TXD47211.1 hypothetical protein ES045_11445 [Polaribacter sp. IC073]